jgi:hypothetical protein
LDPTKGQLDILLAVLEARLRDEGSDVGEVLSVLWDLPFAAKKVAARAAEASAELVDRRAALLEEMGMEGDHE